MRVAIASLFACLMLQTSLVFAAEIRVASDSSGIENIRLILEGPIEDGDFEKFRLLVDNHNLDGDTINGVILNSPGGSVVPALEMGRYIRLKRIVTFAPLSCPDGECICASACALIWLGGISRTGTVYVHRPSLRDDDQRLNFSAWDRAVGAAQDDILLYLHEMRIDESVSGAMLSTNPADILPIQAGRDVAYKDSILEDYSRSRCGPPLSEQSKAYLTLFEEVLKSEGEEGLEYAERELLIILREKSSRVKECNKNVLSAAQKEAQLPS